MIQINTKDFILAMILLPVLDIPWLKFFAMPQFPNARFQLVPALVVYAALAFLLLQQTGVLGSFLNGAAVYAVYDFTTLITHPSSSLSFAIADTLWGGTLFALAFFILDKLRNVF
jgi:uncharacterized membrane protein